MVIDWARREGLLRTQRLNSISALATWHADGANAIRIRQLPCEVHAWVRPLIVQLNGSNGRWDSTWLAQECEAGMDSRFGGPTKEYKGRYRSLVFNLQDPKNKEFMRSVLMGSVPVDMLATMEVKDMASPAMQEERRKAVEQSKMALMDKKSWEKYVGKEQQEGILKCPRCKSMLTEYTEVQTRSADEPTTKKCLCNACGYRWKFC